jgi:tyrosine-protein kinase Etk/Wzc
MTNPNYPSPGYIDPYDPIGDGSNLDIRRYLSLFLSNWYWFAISLFIALTIAYGINRYGDKIFTVSSTLLIKDDQNASGLTGSENILAGAALFNNQQNLKNEMGILKSFSLNLRVINSLSDFKVVYYGIGRRNIVESLLYKRCPFEVIYDTSVYQPYYSKVYITLTTDSTYLAEINGDFKDGMTFKFGETVNYGGFNFRIRPRGQMKFKLNPLFSNKYYFYFARPEEIANSYRGKLSVSPIDKEATLVNLSVSGYIEEQEADYLNRLMDIYIGQGLESKKQTADSTLSFIDKQLSVISDSLRRAEETLQNFRKENKLVDISKEGSHIQANLENFENERSTLKLQKQYYQYLEEYINSRNESGDIVSPSILEVTDPSLIKLVEDLSSAQKKRNELIANLAETTIPVKLLDESIAIIRKTLLENVKNNIVNSQRSIFAIDERINSSDSAIKKLPDTERQLLSIQRKFDVNNTVYTYLLEKRAESGIAKASTVASNKIIDRAEVFNAVQVKPKARANQIKAILISLLVPSILIILLYYFNNKIIDNSDVIGKTKAPIIGYISHNDSKKELPVIDSPGSSLSESFRAVRTTLRYLIKDTSNPVIAITSTISSEGKTFISVNLAAITAMLGKKVLLIGLDLRKPRIHRILGISNDVGLSTYLSRNCDYESVIKKTEIDNLYYAPSGPVPPNPAELVNDDRMKDFILKTKEQFDYIIIDTPPVAVVSDALLLTEFVDINLFIVRQRYSSKNTLELIDEIYKGERLKNMGIIINDISLTGYYGYGLRYGYYKGYGYSYGKNYYGSYSYTKYGYSDDDAHYYQS